jgi:hypothetical protein
VRQRLHSLLPLLALQMEVIIKALQCRSLMREPERRRFYKPKLKLVHMET